MLAGGTARIRRRRRGRRRARVRPRLPQAAREHTTLAPALSAREGASTRAARAACAVTCACEEQRLNSGCEATRAGHEGGAGGERAFSRSRRPTVSRNASISRCSASLRSCRAGWRRAARSASPRITPSHDVAYQPWPNEHRTNEHKTANRVCCGASTGGAAARAAAQAPPPAPRPPRARAAPSCAAPCPATGCPAAPAPTRRRGQRLRPASYLFALFCMRLAGRFVSSFEARPTQTISRPGATPPPRAPPVPPLAAARARVARAAAPPAPPARGAAPPLPPAVRAHPPPPTAGTARCV